MKPIMQAHPAKSTQAEEITVRGYAEGGNGSDLTVIEGVGVYAIERLNEGVYRLVLTRLTTITHVDVNKFGADTPGDVKGLVATVDVDSISNGGNVAGRTSVDFTVYRSGTEGDLLVNEFIFFAVSYRDTTLKTNG